MAKFGERIGRIRAVHVGMGTCSIGLMLIANDCCRQAQAANLGLQAGTVDAEGINADRLAAVAVPALSRVTGDPERYREAYIRMLEKVALLTMPGMAFMIVAADWIVRVLLGPEWSEVWHSWHSHGVRALSSEGLFEPCGVWQLVQSSCTGW